MRSGSGTLKSYRVLRQQGGDFYFVGNVQAPTVLKALSEAKQRYPWQVSPVIEGGRDEISQDYE